MELTPEEKQKIYEEEKSRLEAQEKLKQKSSEKGVWKKKIETNPQVGMLILIILVGALIFVSLPEPDGSAPTAPLIEIGSEMVVMNDSVIIASNEESYAEMFKLAAANDEMGLQSLVAKGKISPLKRGTKISVIEYGGGILDPRFRVRVLDGVHQGESGWMNSQMLK